MRIGDAAAAAGLTPRALRYYEERGLITAHRNSSGQREYDPRDVRHLRALRELLNAGLTIEDVHTLVTALAALPPAERRPPAPEEEPVVLCELPLAVVRRRLAFLDERIERLTELRDGLARRVGRPLLELRTDLPTDEDPNRAPDPADTTRLGCRLGNGNRREAGSRDGQSQGERTRDEAARDGATNEAVA